MKTFLIILLFHICCLVKAQEYVYNGVQQYESVTGNISMKKVIKDDNGNYYIFGTYIGTVDFDNTSGVYNLTATGFLKVFVLKLNSNRNFIAVKSIDGVGSTDLANIKDVVIANNQLIVAGGFSGSVDFDPSASTNIQTVTTGSLIGNEDFFIAKYTLDLDLIWVKKTGSTSSDYINSIHVDGSGTIHAVGKFSGSTDFDTGTTNLIMSTNGQSDAFYWQLDGNGVFLKAFKLGGVYNDEAFTVKVYNNQILISGAFSATVDFNPSTGTNNLVSSSGFNGFIAKYALNDYSYQQAVRITPQVLDMEIDSNGNVFATGLFNAATDDFDPSPTTTSFLTSSTFSKNYILKLDNNLNYLWVKDFGKNDYGNNEFVDFDIDQNGNLFSVSRFKGIVDMDPSANNFYLTPLSVSLYTRYHVFILKLTNDGLFSYAGFVGNTSSDYNFLNDIFVSSNEIVGVGEFDSTIDLDPNTSNYYLTNSNGQKDAYFMRLTENTLSIADFSKVQSQVYPNPTTDFFRVSSTDGIKEVAIYALDGKLIFQKKYNETSIQIPVHEYSKGIYMITILNSNDTVETKKIIIN